MDELDILIEKQRKKRGSMQSEEFIRFVEKTLDKFYDDLPRAKTLTEGTLHEDFEKGKEFLLTLPKFAPNENWGKPGSADREAVNRIFNAIGGDATLEAKLNFLAAIGKEESGITSPRRIISSLIILESLSSILTSFQPSPAGFVFEAFLAALLRGAQIPASGAQTIADLEAFTHIPSSGNATAKKRKGLSISLKLLSPGTAIEGSYTDLIDSLHKAGSMTYVIARKVGGVLKIESFVFTRDNFLKAISTMQQGERLKTTAKLFTIPGKTGAQSLEYLNSLKNWDEKYAELQKTPGYRGKVAPAKEEPKATSKGRTIEPTGAISAEEYDKLQRKYGYADKYLVDKGWARYITESQELLAESSTQWNITSDQLETLGSAVVRTRLAELPYAPERIYKIAELRMKALDATLLDLFSATKSLSDNVNLYFSEEQRNDAISAGQSAISDTTRIAENLKSGIAKDQKDQNNP